MLLYGCCVQYLVMFYWVWFATCNCNKSFVVEANKWVLFSKLSLFMLQLKI